MKEEDIPKTAINILVHLLEWVVMPQGIQNVPAAQQCQINEALQGLTGECCEVMWITLSFGARTLEIYITTLSVL